MMEHQKNNNVLFDEEKLKSSLEKAGYLEYLSENDLKTLNAGLKTSVVKNVHHEGKVMDCSFQILVDSDGKTKLHLNKIKEELDIPDKILGKKLSKAALAELANGKPIGPFNIGKHDLYFHVDKNTNTISMYCANNLGIPNEMMGYKFSDSEKSELDKGKVLGPKVFYAEGHYFIGQFSIEKQAEVNLWKTNYNKGLSKEEALKLITRYNNTKENSPSVFTDIQRKALFIPDHSPVKEDMTLIHNSYEGDKTLKSYIVKSNDQSNTLVYNYTLNSYYLNMDKNLGFPERMFKNSFTEEEIRRLKKGEILQDKTFTFNSGDKINANLKLIDKEGKYSMIFQINSIRKHGEEKFLVSNQSYDLQKFSEHDKLIMDLVDKKDFKVLNKFIESGIKPSEDINRLIFSNSRIDDNVKQQIANILKPDPKLLNSSKIGLGKDKSVAGSKDNSPEIPITSKDIKNPKIPTVDEIRNKGANKGVNKNKTHVASAVKGLFNDM